MIGIASLLPLLVVGLIIWLVLSRRDESDAHDREPGIGSVRRLVLYGLAFIALIFAAVGISLLLGGALDAAFGDLVLREHRTDFAIALAFTTVGIPAWLSLMFVAYRTVRAHPVERRSQARRWYLNLARGTALVIVMAHAVSVLQYAMGASSFDAGSWGWMVTWASIWLLHDRLAAAEPAEGHGPILIDRLYTYFAAVIGLGFLLSGLIASISVPLTAAYDGLLRDELFGSVWDEAWREGIALALVGAVVWWWHWLRPLDTEEAGASLWRVYVFLFGVLAGIGLTVIPAGIILYTTLEWFIVDTGNRLAVDHFDVIPGALAFALVGLATWAYFRLVVVGLSPDADEGSEPRRIYRYVVAGAGLIALAGGIATVLALLIDLLVAQSPDLIHGQGWWRDDLVASITLLVLGLPLWAYFWTRTVQAVTQRPIEERQSTSRRVYLFGVLGVAVLAVLITLTIVLYQLFEAILESEPLRDMARDARWPIAILVTAAVIALYHWIVVREDQAGRADSTPVRPHLRRREVILLAAHEASDVARALAAVPGVRLQHWRREDELTPAVASPTPEEPREAEVDRSEPPSPEASIEATTEPAPESAPPPGSEDRGSVESAIAQAAERQPDAPPLSAAASLTSEALTRLRDEVAASDHDRLLVIEDGDGYRVVPYTVTWARPGPQGRPRPDVAE